MYFYAESYDGSYYEQYYLRHFVFALTSDLFICIIDFLGMPGQLNRVITVYAAST